MSGPALSIAMARRLRATALRVNAPLLIGGLMVMALVICALAAPLLAPFDPIAPVVRFVAGKIVPAPYPPGTQGMILGSDTLRRDLLSRLIYGSRYTLLFCGVAALVRVAIGGLLGMLAGWYPRASRLIDVIVSAWSSVPSLFFALLPIALVNRRGSLVASTIAFTVTLSLTGWAEAAVRCRVAVQGLSAAPFVESAFTIGLSRWKVLWRHILPNLRDLLVVEASYAMASALLLLAELGFLGYFVGDAEREVVGTSVSVDPIYAEWGGMLAKGLRDQSSGVWLFLVPVVAFTLAILAFNLLAEGLRTRK
jgi:ABC-type dipeptide/oligopeptide/nickel transport system permease subunit